MEISITNKGILGVLVAFTLGLGYLSISYFSVSEFMGYLFSGLTVLVFVMLLLHINGLMNKQRKQERYTPLQGYNPKPEVPYVPQSQISSYQPQGQTIGDGSSGNKQYLINAESVTIIDSDKESKADKSDDRVELLYQLSDTQVMFSGFADQLINPDIYQFKDDLGTTAKKLSNLSVSEYSKKMGLHDKLQELSNKLEDAEAHEFYIGMESVNEFASKLRPCVSIANSLIEQIKKNSPSTILPTFGDILSENVDLLKNEWSKAEKYLERGNIDKLQIAFRRFGYAFHRLGTLPDADKLRIADELKDIGEQLRNLSSTQKYFMMFHYGSTSSLDEIRKKIESLLERLDKLR
jgi:hypothetical protein